MEKIRNAGKKHRGIMLAVVICLCLAMVIGFAVGGSLGNNNTASLEDQIAAYENYIAELLAEETQDNAWHGSVAAAYATLASLYSQAGDTEKYTEANTASNTHYVTYYEYLVEEQRNAEGDNETLLAAYLSYLATYYSNLGETEKASAAEAESLGYYETIYSENLANAKTEAENNPDDAAYQFRVADWLLYLANVYTQQGNSEQSAASYGEAAQYCGAGVDILLAALAETPDDTEKLREVAYYIATQANIYSQQGDSEQSAAAYLRAADYYYQSYETLPEDATADDKALVLTDYAVCLNAGGSSEEAAARYEEAIQLAPGNINVVQPYFNYILYKGGSMNAENIKAAYELLPEFEQYFTTAGEDKDTFDNLVATITFYNQIFNSVQETTTTPEENTTVTEEESSAAGEETTTTAE